VAAGGARHVARTEARRCEGLVSVEDMRFSSCADGGLAQYLRCEGLVSAEDMRFSSCADGGLAQYLRDGPSDCVRWHMLRGLVRSIQRFS
jgi:hypothetical protein